MGKETDKRIRKETNLTYYVVVFLVAALAFGAAMLSDLLIFNKSAWPFILYGAGWGVLIGAKTTAKYRWSTAGGLLLAMFACFTVFKNFEGWWCVSLIVTMTVGFVTLALLRLKEGMDEADEKHLEELTKRRLAANKNPR